MKSLFFITVFFISSAHAQFVELPQYCKDDSGQTRFCDQIRMENTKKVMEELKSAPLTLSLIESIEKNFDVSCENIRSETACRLGKICFVGHYETRAPKKLKIKADCNNEDSKKVAVEILFDTKDPSAPKVLKSVAKVK